MLFITVKHNNVD